MTETVRTECDACGYLTQCHPSMGGVEGAETLHYCGFCYRTPTSELRGPERPLHLHINRNSNAILDALGGARSAMFPKRNPEAR